MPLCPLRIMNSLEKRCCPHPHSHLHSHTRSWNVVLTINTVGNINHSLFTFFLYVPLLFADLSEWEDFVHSPHAGPVRIFFIVYFKNSVYLPDKYTYNVFGGVFFVITISVNIVKKDEFQGYFFMKIKRRSNIKSSVSKIIGKCASALPRNVKQVINCQ